MNNPATEGLQLAGRFRRLVATALDALFVPLLTIVLVMIAGVLEDAEDYRDSAWMLWVLILAIASYLMLNGYGLWRRGQTLGKMIMGIAIVAAPPIDDSPDANQLAPLWKLICIRALFFPLLFVVIVPQLAVLPILDQLFIFGKQRRCLHDLAAGTIVVRRKNKP